MDEIKCPKCGKVLTDNEKEKKICQECGCLFEIIDSKKGKKSEAVSAIIKDYRKINYKSWIKFYIFFLFLWSILTIFGVLQGYVHTSNPWNWIILVVGVVVYIIVFILIQFK